MALCPSKQTIFAYVHELRAATGDEVYLTTGRSMVYGTRALPSLRWVAELRTGDLRGRNYPLFSADGEQALRAVADTEADALAKLAALCSVAVV